MFPLLDSDGKEIKGSGASLANFLLLYGKRFDIEADKDSLVQAIGNELNAHPELKKRWYDTYLFWALRTDKNKGRELIREYLKTFDGKTDLTEKDYLSLLSSYRAINDAKAIDSVRSLALSKYPKGTIYRQGLQDKFYKEKDLLKKEEIFNNFKSLVKNSDRTKNYFANNLALGFYNKGDNKKFEYYADLITDPSVKAGLYNFDCMEAGRKR